MSEVQVYFQRLQQTINQQNGQFLAKLLCLPLDNVISPQLRQLTQQLQRTDVLTLCNSFFQNDKIAAMIGYSLLAIAATVEGTYEVAYRHQLSAYNQVLDLFGSKDFNTSWLVPLVIRSSNDVKEIASLADASNNDENFKLLRESLNTLLKAFNLITKEKSPVTSPGSKKLAIFGITNILFKIYFKVNTLQLCGNLIRVIEMKGPGSIMENLHLFNVCDVVMYKYYIGRLKMFEDRYEESRDCLRFAFQYTSKQQKKNRQRILISLIPVEMCLGVFPSPLIASEYDLPEFVELGSAIQLGNLTQYNEIMSKNQSIFIKHGIYLVLEQTKALLYRNLTRRIYLLYDKTIRFNLPYLEIAINYLLSLSNKESSEENYRIEDDESMDLNEIECILSNLIYQGRIKGYISHEKRYLVLSKTDPFPTKEVIKKYIPSK
mmetsp:Transcript_12857/g.13891  ORF Transcript_12857/g.13891 Transcript_12857/m.13891 type:complete len:433 (-) Transcript_12857:743-2041(-)